MSIFDLAPTADVPPSRATKTNPVCDGPCPTCGQRVLTGHTRGGQVAVVDLQPKRIYIVRWHEPGQPPEMSESRGYPVHECLTQGARACR